MLHSKTIVSLSIALFASALAACGAQVEEGGQVEVSAGALEQSNDNPNCSIGNVQTSSCVDPGILKDTAFQVCQQAGLSLTDFQYEGICDGWKTDFAQYECCPASPPSNDPNVPPPPDKEPPPSDPNQPPPAPPAVCLTGSFGDGQTCTDLGNVKQQAFETCTQAGLVLFDIQVIDYGSCSPYEGLLVEYKCAAEGPNCP